MSELEQFALRLRHEPGFSRNRHFDELSRPEARTMRRRLRRLEGIARELATADSIELRPEGQGYRLTLRFFAVRLRRETFLTQDEHALLTREASPAASSRLLTPDAA